MSTYKRDWDEAKSLYSPEQISGYVEKGLERMYMGTAPTLSQLQADYGKERYECLAALLIDEIFKFAGLKDKFPEEVMTTVAQTMRAEYPWLKVTELMHFVYLFRLGTFDKFYGKPSGAALMQMLRQYIYGERERLRGEFVAKREKEERILELSRQRMGGRAAEEAWLRAETAAAFSEEAQARARWRYRPWGTAMARAFFADRILGKYPGDMDEREQRQWARENEAYVKLHPNLNPAAAIC